VTVENKQTSHGMSHRMSHRVSHRMPHVSRNGNIIHFRLRTPVIEDEWVVNGYRNKQIGIISSILCGKDFRNIMCV